MKRRVGMKYDHWVAILVASVLGLDAGTTVYCVQPLVLGRVANQWMASLLSRILLTKMPR